MSYFYKVEIRRVSFYLYYIDVIILWSVIEDLSSLWTFVVSTWWMWVFILFIVKVLVINFAFV